MNDATNMLGRAVGAVHRHRGLLLPLAAAGLIFVLLVPLPPGLMDLLLAGNLALSALVLLTCIYVATPLEFSVLPSVLLGTTLLRLVLNVASTRLILTAAAAGPADQAQLAAGAVIWGFANFVTAGSLAVGVILFAIIVAIQFIVVTKGATRISEVAARFVLDAMPGKQMAIDAELTNGSITAEQAVERRQRVAQEADFYGAMDGASKFLRGDAVAAIVILLTCIGGGLYVGVCQYNMPLGAALDLYTRLTIGDGLVTQIPAFITSLGAALLVTRSRTRSQLGEQVVGQLLSRPVVLVITAAFLGLLSLTSLPKLPLLAIGTGCVGLAWTLSRRNSRERAGAQPNAAGAGTSLAPRPAGKAAPVVSTEDLSDAMTVDTLRIEVGYALVSLVDPQGGNLLERIAALRKHLAAELGLVTPPVRIRDNMRLESHGYLIYIRGNRVGEGVLYPRQLLAVGDESEGKGLVGRQTRDPAFGAPAIWISPTQRDRAEELGFAVVEPTAVLTTHLAELIRVNAAEMLSREQAARMVAALRDRSPSLAAEATERYKIGEIHGVLRGLLRERVSIRDVEAIVEAMSDCPAGTDQASLVEHVRAALGRCVSQPYCGKDGKLYCVSLDGPLEDAIAAATHRGPRGVAVAMDAQMAERISSNVSVALGKLRSEGKAPVLVCSSAVRGAVRQLIAPEQPDAAVLAYNEVDSVDVETVQSVSLE